MQSTIDAEDHDRIALRQEFIDRIDHFDRRDRVLWIGGVLIEIQKLFLPLGEQFVTVRVVVAADRIGRHDAHAFKNSLRVRLVQEFRVGDGTIVVDSQNSDLDQVGRLGRGDSRGNDHQQTQQSTQHAKTPRTSRQGTVHKVTANHTERAAVVTGLMHI